MDRTSLEIDFGAGFEPAQPPTSDFRKYRKTALVEAQQISFPFRVQTLEGAMVGAPGDYLMRGAVGELYPCAQEVFRATYEPA